MEIKGKVIQAFDQITGTSKAGNPWKKQEYVIETFDNYPKKIHFDFFGDKVDQYQLRVGDSITLSFDIESREYQGRWYTSIRGWKADKENGAGAGADMSAAPAPSDFPPFEAGGESDDLPF